MAWDKSQVREFVKSAKKSYSKIWDSELITNDFREAILARQFTIIVTTQMVETMKSEDVSKLWSDMCVEAGLIEG